MRLCGLDVPGGAWYIEGKDGASRKMQRRYQRTMMKRSIPSAAEAEWLQRRWIRVLLWGLLIATAVMIFVFPPRKGNCRPGSRIG